MTSVQCQNCQFLTPPYDVIVVFVTVLGTVPNQHFFAPLLLSSQYLDPTVSCVSWEKLMTVMKHFFSEEEIVCYYLIVQMILTFANKTLRYSCFLDEFISFKKVTPKFV